MEYRENTGGFESLTWISDRQGAEYVCSLADTQGIENFEELPGEIRERCLNVNSIIGTERW
jgi:hypothetical protein